MKAKYLSSTYTANLPSSTILRPSFHYMCCSKSFHCMCCSKSFHYMCCSKSSTISLLFSSVMSSGDFGFRLANLPFWIFFALKLAILPLCCLLANVVQNNVSSIKELSGENNIYRFTNKYSLLRTRFRNDNSYTLTFKQKLGK